MEEKHNIIWESPKNQDFICYFNDSDELITYDNFNKNSIKVNGNLELKLQHQITKKWLEWTIITFKIDGEKYPVIFSLDEAIIFSKHLDKIARFYKLFNYTISKEIELSGKSLSKMCSIDNLNTETFFYLYNKSPNYDIEFNIEFKFYEDVSKRVINGFRITYPEIVDMDFRFMSKDIEKNLHRCLNGQAERLSQINKEVVKKNKTETRKGSTLSKEEIENLITDAKRKVNIFESAFKQYKNKDDALKSFKDKKMRGFSQRTLERAIKTTYNNESLTFESYVKMYLTDNLTDKKRA